MASKRKQPPPRASKKAKTPSSDIRVLEETISSSLTANVNLLADLVEKEKDTSIVVALAAGHALHRSLIRYGRADLLRFGQEQETSLGKTRAWVAERSGEHVDNILQLLHSKDPVVQNGAMDLLLRWIKYESSLLSKKWSFAKKTFSLVCQALIDPSMEQAPALVSNHIGGWVDLRVYLLQYLQEAEISSLEQERCFQLLMALPVPSESTVNDLYAKQKNMEESRIPLLQLNVQKKAWGGAWLALMSHPLPEDLSKQVLEQMHDRILPYMARPKQMMDFLADCYTLGGRIAVLALNGLFYLIHKHGLDYPKFYEQVLRLWTLDVLERRYRSSFFTLSDLFLSSSHLSAYIAAAFAKRMARLATMAPPEAALGIIPILYNVVKQHPACLALIHREDNPMHRLKVAGPRLGKEHTIQEGEDPYLMNESDPAKCHALESSLWEVEALLHHYDPSVARLAKIFEGMFTKPKYDVAVFSKVDYEALISGELKRKTKGGVPTTFRPPDGLFGGASWSMWGSKDKK